MGIADKGSIAGIEKDYPTLRKQDADGFMQYLVQLINSFLGKQHNNFISTYIRKIDGKEVCIINVKKSTEPVFLKFDNSEEFYIRASSTSQPLNVRETFEYTRSHWGKG